MPNKFRDEKESAKRPKSPRRFKNLDIDSRARPKEAGWALIQILLSVRRAIPDIDAFIASGSPTSNDSPNSGVVWRGPLISPSPYLEGGYPTLPLIITLSGNHFGSPTQRYCI